MKVKQIMEIISRDGEVLLTLDVDTLKGVDLRGEDLTNADLRGVDLQDALLRDADLAGADLTGATLRGADLRGADLAGANLANACLEGAEMRCMNLHRADLRHANLKSASLQGSDLTEADLTGANLDFAGLYYTKLSRALLPIGVAYITTEGFWDVTIVNNHMRIGCQHHTIEVWDAFSDDEIAKMHEIALGFWQANKQQIMAIARATQAQSTETA